MAGEAVQLRADNLSKRYRGHTVVQDVSLQVSAGQIVGLLGPNGAGKTTSFYMMVGLVAPNSGRIRLGDRDITRAPMHRRARLGLGYLPQEASVFRKLSVAENVLAILQLRRDLDRRARGARLEQLLDELGIGHLADARAISLSGGERRRVEIARALAAEPRFILLDEPFAGIDPISIGDIRSIVRHLQERGIGVLITDHNVRETLTICNYAFILSEGTVIAHGSADSVLADTRVREVYLGEDFRL
ncbi:MAG: LPS export ABC transporter ATP-binding protein [Salinisphaera sp.]|nr:LPS export ABC transporter ATP-binding protein [Salinisphaera sp.]MDN5937363.1 LPS export ABC transporter ATP-binding protein [Salinisphaera sp.]